MAEFQQLQQLVQKIRDILPEITEQAATDVLLRNNLNLQEAINEYLSVKDNPKAKSEQQAPVSNKPTIGGAFTTSTTNIIFPNTTVGNKPTMSNSFPFGDFPSPRQGTNSINPTSSNNPQGTFLATKIC